MQIVASRIALQGQHSALVEQRRSETLRIERTGAAPLAKVARAEPASADQSGEQLAIEQDVLLIKLLVEALSGRKINIARFDSAAPQASAAPASPPTTQFSVEYRFSEFYRETESARFQAAGSVTTADGTQITLAIELSMDRSFESTTTIGLSNGQRQDPLVLNLAGNAAQLSSAKYSFDLDGDGQAEQISFATGNSAFLALDLDRNGRIDNGLELFGTRSGDGFADLARHDSDANGFIDQGDPVFARLLAYDKTADGSDRTRSLIELGIGALYLHRVETPFDLRGSSNQTLGTVRSTGLFINEDFSSGTLQQVDLVV
ncbi:MAG: hypothetical protein KBG75_03675 [Pseudomonadales bacterium]|nr:hypothetical protein [Pseudomonadales bacterium]